PPAGWIGLLLFVLFVGFSLVVADTRRSRRRVIVEMREAASPAEKKAQARKTQPILDPQGLPYPHPIINVGTCIGCHACVDACPHDVLAIINGKAALVAVEQCMEDTTSQAQSPTAPTPSTTPTPPTNIPP